MRIEHFMTRRVVAVSPDTSILAAARLMLEHHISGLPVVDACGHVVGIVSESDLLRDDGKGMAGSPWLQLMVGPDARTGEPAQLGERKVAEVMTRDPRTLTAKHDAIEALRLMQDARCRHLPIVHEGELLGIVSRGDFRGIELDRLDEETGLWERIG